MKENQYYINGRWVFERSLKLLDEAEAVLFYTKDAYGADLYFWMTTNEEDPIGGTGATEEEAKQDFAYFLNEKLPN